MFYANPSSPVQGMKSATTKDKLRVVRVLFSEITGTQRKANNTSLHG